MLGTVRASFLQEAKLASVYSTSLVLYSSLVELNHSDFIK